MKRPASRCQGKQLHRCCVCHETGHRVDTCKHPAAQRLQELQSQLKQLKQRHGLKHRVLRQESKNRKSPQDNRKTYRLKQQELYSGTRVRHASPAEIRRQKSQHDLLQGALTSEASSVQWLLQHKFIHRPRTCDACEQKKLYEVFESDHKGPVEKTLFLFLNSGITVETS